MAQPPSDHTGRRIKDLSSEVKKLRGWSASDESVAERLTDALNELTGQRLIAHQYVPAVEDAQDALTRANKLVAAHGAVGPFTPIDDGVRFFTATTQLAATQVGVGQPQLGGQMAQALRGWVGLLPHVDLVPYVGARTATWLLATQARAALASGDLASANAFADAATARARDGGLADGPDAPVLVDALRLAADVRWISGIDHDAIALSREAADAAAAVAGPVLGSAGRVAHAWADRVMQPLVEARRDLADRLVGSGQGEAGLSERHGLIVLLEGLVGRLGAPARAALVRTLADLAHDLMTLERDEEALETAGRAAETAGVLAVQESRAGEHLDTQFAAVTAVARALVRTGEHAEAAEALASLFDRFGSLRRPAGHEAALAGATLVRAEVERAAGDQASSERSLREFQTLVSALRQATPAAALYADVPAETFARDRARGVASRSPLPPPAWSNLSDADALVLATREPRAVPAPPAPVTEVAEPVRVPVREPEAMPLTEPEPEPAIGPEPVWEPEPAIEPEPVWEPQPQPVFEPEPVIEPAAEPRSSARAELEAARGQWSAAKASGHRRDTLTAATVVVDVLRPLVSGDARTWGPQLVEALEELGEARFRAGDWWGSRAPKKEAKQLARELGL